MPSSINVALSNNQCVAIPNFSERFCSRSICRRRFASRNEKHVCNLRASSSDQPVSSKSAETLKSLESILGSQDEDAETPGRVIDSIRSSSSQDASVSEPLATSSFLTSDSSSRQLTASTSAKDDAKTAHKLTQTLVDLAKEFLADKLKRPTAEDLIVEEDAQKLRKIKPRLAYLLLAINLGVYAAGIVAGLGPEGGDAQQDYFLALAKIDSGIEAGEYYRLITANFLHDSFVHLGASCYALATVAPAIEEVLGWDIFLGVYMLSAVAGSVGTFIFGDAITVGASSGIFGVIGALVAYLWKNRSLSRTADQLTSIAGVVTVNLIMGSIQETSIDNLGHAAGLLVGMYLGWGLSPSLRPVEGSKEEDGSDAVADGANEDNSVDVMHVDHAGPLQRWAGYASFAMTLGLMVVGTVVARTGELPPPKGFELFVFH